MHNLIFLIVPEYILFIDRLSIFGRGQSTWLLLYLERREVLKMKNVSCFELYPSILDTKTVQNLLLELFPYMHTSLNEDGGLDMYITRVEYLFVLNELSKLNNYALTMPDSIEESNTTFNIQLYIHIVKYRMIFKCTVNFIRLKKSLKYFLYLHKQYES